MLLWGETSRTLNPTDPLAIIFHISASLILPAESIPRMPRNALGGPATGHVFPHRGRGHPCSVTFILHRTEAKFHESRSRSTRLALNPRAEHFSTQTSGSMTVR